MLGPMYGRRAVSEQELAEKAMRALPPQAVVVGDRNFGVLWTAHAGQHRGHDVLLRLTRARAFKLQGAPLSQGLSGHLGSQPLGWRQTPPG
ncbi:MAG: hypothetical protein M3Y07_07355 [Acidobacteriota bacterium]|nr:hypothetical protein [Acidobacteriota bacterium]